MIIGHLNILERYLGAADTSTVQDLLVRVRVGSVKKGEWLNLRGEAVRALLLDKSNFQPGIFEFHRLHDDIHVTIEGQDTIYMADGTAALVKKEYDEKEDYGLMEGNHASVHTLFPNALAVVHAGELHSNRIDDNMTLKLVIKRRVSS